MKQKQTKMYSINSSKIVFVKKKEERKLISLIL
jgi:hypothetical protein